MYYRGSIIILLDFRLRYIACVPESQLLGDEGVPPVAAHVAGTVEGGGRLGAGV